MDDLTAQQLLLVGLLQAPSSSLATLVSLPSSPVYTTLAALLAHPAHPASRHLLHAVIARLAQSRNALPLPLLALYVHASLPTNHARVAAVIADAIAATPKLAQQLAATLPEALRVALESGSGSESGAAIVCSLVRAVSPTAGTVLTPQGIQDVVKTVTQHYPPRNGNDRLRLALLETVHDLVHSCATHLGVQVLQPVLESLLLLRHKDTLLDDLAQDLASLYPSLAEELSQLVLGAVGPVARSTKDLIARFRRSAAHPHPQGGDELDWVARLRRTEEEEKQRTHNKEEAGGGGGPDSSSWRDDSVAKDRGKAAAAAPPPLTAEREAELTKVREEKELLSLRSFSAGGEKNPALLVSITDQSRYSLPPLSLFLAPRHHPKSFRPSLRSSTSFLPNPLPSSAPACFTHASPPPPPPPVPLVRI